MNLPSASPKSRTWNAGATGFQPHLDHPGDMAKADQLNFRNVRDQRSLAHRRGTEIARATSVLRLNAVAGKNHQMCARTYFLSAALSQVHLARSCSIAERGSEAGSSASPTKMVRLPKFVTHFWADSLQYWKERSSRLIVIFLVSAGCR